MTYWLVIRQKDRSEVSIKPEDGPVAFFDKIVCKVRANSLKGAIDKAELYFSSALGRPFVVCKAIESVTLLPADIPEFPSVESLEIDPFEE